MNKKKILSVHHAPISVRKDGRYITKVKQDSGIWKQISGKTEPEVYEKLYAYYFSDDTYTLEEIYERCMIHRRDNTAVKAKTLQECANEWTKFFKNSPMAKSCICSIKPVMILRHFQLLTRNREYTHKRISNARSVLNGIMTYAIEEEYIDHNPVSEVNFKQLTYKPVENQNDVFSIDDVIKLLSYLKDIADEPYALAIRLDFNLLIRIGELKALTWDDINWKEKTVYIHTQALIERQLKDDMTFSTRSTTVSDQMKGYTSHGYRKQPLTDEALAILKQARDLNPFGKYIFMSDNLIITTDAFNGSNLATLSKLMGHSNTETTLHYLRNIHKGQDDSVTMSRLGFENTLARSNKNKGIS